MLAKYKSTLESLIYVMGKEHSLYRKKTNYVCDCCGGDTSKGVIIKDKIWKEIVDKFESRIFEDPKDNLLCINCIENS